MYQPKAAKLDMPGNYEIFYPGVYSPKDKAAIDEAMKERLAINQRGPVDIQALIRGDLDDQNLPGIEKPRRHGPPPSDDGGKDGPPEGPPLSRSRSKAMDIPPRTVRSSPEITTLTTASTLMRNMPKSWDIRISWSIP